MMSSCNFRRRVRSEDWVNKFLASCWVMWCLRGPLPAHLVSCDAMRLQWPIVRIRVVQKSGIFCGDDGIGQISGIIQWNIVLPIGTRVALNALSRSVPCGPKGLTKSQTSGVCQHTAAAQPIHLGNQIPGLHVGSIPRAVPMCLGSWPDFPLGIREPKAVTISANSTV